MKTTLQGLSLIDGVPAAPSTKTFTATNPATGDTLGTAYHEATPEQVQRAGDLAAGAFPAFARVDGARRAALLRGIADEIMALGDDLLERFTAETGLPRGRAEGERARTCGQLRLFADLVATDAWADPRVDLAQPDRQPLPKPDTRSLLRPIGPVAVFGPANFPLAFSVAGGDTASALAAGCPVVVKAHSSHPGTSELVGQAVTRAVKTAGLPAGVFTLLFGGGRTVGRALVGHPGIRGVGFTGSKAAGRELFTLCTTRPTPIPFFGELSSINPVCLLPGALAARGEAIATGLASSLTLGCGQFCTNPGLILYVAGAPGAEAWVERLSALLRNLPAGPMLNAGTRRSYDEGLARVGGAAGVETLVSHANPAGLAHAGPALFRCTAETFRARPELHEEVFGPAGLLVACRDLADMQAAVEALEGQLTATVHQADDDLPPAADLLAALEQRVGRIVFNGFPTGVEVCASMVHGGPWPATTDSRFTSVGTGAILRWVRPVCWQNAPRSVLPEALRPAEIAPKP